MAAQAAFNSALNAALADLMLSLCAAVGPMQTIEPEDVARAFAGIASSGDQPWPSYLQSVRNTAIGLARIGKLIIYHKGSPADPESFRGTYRLGCPNLS